MSDLPLAPAPSPGRGKRRLVVWSLLLACVPAAAVAGWWGYGASQRLGADLRAAGVQACLYVSARAEGRQLNLAVFENVFRPGRPLREEPWSCTANRAGAEFRARSLLGPERRYSYARAQFEVAGRLPAPALS